MTQIEVKPRATGRLEGVRLLLAEDAPDNQRLIGFEAGGARLARPGPRAGPALPDMTVLIRAAGPTR